MPPFIAGLIPAEPNIPPPGPVFNKGAPNTLSGLAPAPGGLAAPKALKLLTIWRGGEAGLEALPLSGDNARLESVGVSGVGGTPESNFFGLGGNRPPGTYLNPEAWFPFLNFSVSRLPGT